MYATTRLRSGWRATFHTSIAYDCRTPLFLLCRSLGRNQFCRVGELFGPPFGITILKVLRTQILHHSLDFNAFCVIEDYCSQTFKISVIGGAVVLDKLQTIFIPRLTITVYPCLYFLLRWVTIVEMFFWLLLFSNTKQIL